MNFMGVDWDIIFSHRNYFIPCLIGLIIFIILFIKLRDIIILLSICVMLIAVFMYSPWGVYISSKTKTVLTIIIVILGSIVVTLISPYNSKR